MHVAITGSSGFLGTALTSFLTAGGHEVTRIVRRPPTGSGEIRWDPQAGELDPEALASIEFEMEWPPRSGRRERFPEIAEARWMTLDEAWGLMLKSQLPMLDALEERLRN